MLTSKKHLLTLCAAIACAITPAAFAGGGNPSGDGKGSKDVIDATPAQSDWQFSLGMPMWLAGLSGDVGVGNRTTSVDVTTKQIFKHLDATFAAAGEVRYRKFGVYADFLYLKLSAGDFLAGLQTKQYYGDLDGSYRFAEGNWGNVDALAGLRVTSVQQQVTLFPSLPVLGGSASASRTWVDPYVGVRGRVNITKAIYFTAKTDVGGFNAASKIAVEAYGAFGCQFTKNIYGELGYKYLYDDYHRNGFLWKTSTAGAQLTLGLRF